MPVKSLAARLEPGFFWRVIRNPHRDSLRMYVCTIRVYTGSIWASASTGAIDRGLSIRTRTKGVGKRSVVDTQAVLVLVSHIVRNHNGRPSL